MTEPELGAKRPPGRWRRVALAILGAVLVVGLEGVSLAAGFLEDVWTRLGLGRSAGAVFVGRAVAALVVFSWIAVAGLAVNRLFGGDWLPPTGSPRLAVFAGAWAAAYAVGLLGLLAAGLAELRARRPATLEASLAATASLTLVAQAAAVGLLYLLPPTVSL